VTNQEVIDELMDLARVLTFPRRFWMPCDYYEHMQRRRKAILHAAEWMRVYTKRSGDVQPPYIGSPESRIRHPRRDSVEGNP
jgi:hypothetical protein